MNTLPNRLATEVRAQFSDFSVAGTKDKYAITTQRVVVRNVRPQQLHRSINGRGAGADGGQGGNRYDALLGNMRVGNFQYCDGSLALGGAYGKRVAASSCACACIPY